jgi:hypothetical protein
LTERVAATAQIHAVQHFFGMFLQRLCRRALAQLRVADEFVLVFGDVRLVRGRVGVIGAYTGAEM